MRIAVVGLGYWGPNLARNVAASPHTTLAAICDLDETRLASISAQYPAAKAVGDPAAVLADPEVDAVAVATPVDTHFALVKAALLAGKHVLVEKPFVTDPGQAEELVALADEQERVLMVDHVFLYSPAVRKLAEYVHAGELGELHYVDSVRINLGLVQHDVNVLWDLAAHDLSIMDHLVRRPARSVVAIGESHSGNSLADVAYLHLDYGDGLLCSVHVNWLSPVKIRHFLVGGSRRSALYNELDPSERLKIYDRGIDVSGDPEGKRDVLVSYRTGDVIAPRLDSVEPLRAMIDHFASCAMHGKTPISDGRQGVRVVQILAATEESLAKGSAQIDLPHA